MDPNACLQRLLDAFRDEDRHTAIEALEDMAVWIIKGGAFPDDPRGIQHPINIEHFRRQMVELTRLLNEYREASVVPLPKDTPF